MKKLMLAAVAALSVGAFAGLCDDEQGPQDEPGCALYDVTVKVKTLTPKWMKCSKWDLDDAVYFVDGNRTFNGILWMCDDVCDDFEAGPNFVMWEKATQLAVTAPLSWDTNDNVFVASEANWEVVDRYGKTAEKVECLWSMELSFAKKQKDKTFLNVGAGELIAAGFGSFDKKLLLPKSISGNVVGVMTPISKETAVHCDDPELTLGKVWPLCDDSFTDWCCDGEEVEEVVASGTWSIKYNKSLSKGKKSLRSIVPSYAQGK